MSGENTEVIQSLTSEQVKEVADRVGLTEDSIRATVRFMNNNDFISLGLVEMTPDVVVGFSLCEQQMAGDI